MSSERKPKWLDLDNGCEGTFLEFQRGNINNTVRPVIYPQSTSLWNLLISKKFTYPDDINEEDIYKITLTNSSNYKGIETDWVIHASTKNKGIIKRLNILMLEQLNSARKREETIKMQNVRLSQNVNSLSQSETKEKANRNALESKKDYNPFIRDDYGFGR